MRDHEFSRLQSARNSIQIWPPYFLASKMIVVDSFCLCRCTGWEWPSPTTLRNWWRSVGRRISSGAPLFLLSLNDWRPYFRACLPSLFLQLQHRHRAPNVALFSSSWLSRSAQSSLCPEISLWDEMPLHLPLSDFWVYGSSGPGMQQPMHMAGPVAMAGIVLTGIRRLLKDAGRSQRDVVYAMCVTNGKPCKRSSDLFLIRSNLQSDKYSCTPQSAHI